MKPVASILVALAALAFVAFALQAPVAADSIVVRMDLHAWDPEVSRRVTELMASGKNKGVEQPKLTHNSKPDYTKALRNAGVDGIVHVTARVGVDGRVAEFTESDGNPQLVRATKTAMEKWRFRPLRVDGAPREVRLAIEMTYTIDRGSGRP